MKNLAIGRLWLVAGGIALLLGILLFSGVSPLGALASLYHGSIGDPGRMGRTLEKATPLLIAGLAAFIALRVGLFNIGVEGQLLVGALAAAVVGARIPDVFGLLLAVLAACAAGALWAAPAAWIKAYRGGHEVITTIMLNNVAGFLTLYLAAGPLKAAGKQSPETAHVLLRLPSFSVGGVPVNVALLLAVLGVVGVAIWFGRSVVGFEWRLVGANPEAARFAGVSSRQVLLRGLILSGAVAGFAGAVQVLAFEGRFYPDISGGIGFDALGVALLAGNSALGIIASGAFFAILASGGVSLAAQGVPKGITQVVLGVLILVVAAYRYRRTAARA